MMTVDQVITLLQNGFTKEEITQMEQSPVESHSAQDPQQTPEQPAQEQPAQEPQQEPEHEPHPDPKPEQPAPPNDIDSRLTGIEKNIASLIRSIQQSNLKNDSFGSTPDSLEDQTDKIMASLIRPEPAKKE